MAKTKGAKRGDGAEPSAKAPLAPAVATFARGDYAAARTELRAMATSPELSEGSRTMAADLIRATWLERGALWVGVACVLLFGLVIFIASLKQP